MISNRPSIRIPSLIFTLAAVLGSLLVTAGCNRQEVSHTPGVISPLPLPDPTSTQGQTSKLECQEDFEKRELREPYQRQGGGQPRYTLSAAELEEILILMGIESLCIPPEFGAPFLNVDWNEADLPATGRMVSLGFEELYGGGGWSSAYLVYASYDFEIGSEYDTFADEDDFQALQSGTLVGNLQAGSANGFVRYHAGISMGSQVIMKTYLFPFENYYVAGVVNLGVYDPDLLQGILAEMEAGTHPDLEQVAVRQMDELVQSLVFGR